MPFISSCLLYVFSVFSIVDFIYNLAKGFKNETEEIRSKDRFFYSHG